MWTSDQVVNDRYRILGEVAQGELGRVRRALDERSGQTCALEFVAFDPGKNGGWREAAEEEIKRLRALENPVIVTPEVIEEAPDGLLIVHEYLDGLTLDEVIRAQGPLSVPRACFIARRVAMALEAAHHAGVLHGDLNPSNIFLVRQNNKETVKVLGFGTFGLKKVSFVNMARLTSGGGHSLSGAPEYISPEQALGTVTEALDGRSDIYSLGIILYQALSGSHPFKGQSAMEVLLAHVFSAPPSLAQFPELAIPEVLDSLALRCMAKRREDRPSSATVLVDQLGPWEERLPTFEPTKPGEDEAPFPPQHFPSAASPQAESQQQSVLIASTAETPLPASEAFRAGAPQVDPEFVADLHTPALAGPAVPSSPAAPMDVVLDRVPAPLTAAVRETPRRQDATTSAPLLFSGYIPGGDIGPPLRTGRKWIWVAAVLLFLIAGACGWLFFTGRTYWFRPEYLQRRISLMHWSLPAGGADSPAANQTSGEPAFSQPGSVPVNTTRPGMAASPSSVVPPSAAAPLPPARGVPQSTTDAPPAVPSASNAARPATASPPQVRQARSARPVRSSRPPIADAQHLRSIGPSRTRSMLSIHEAMQQGESYFERGQYDEAIRAYRTGLEHDPSNLRLRADIAQARKAKAAEAKFLAQ